MSDVPPIDLKNIADGLAAIQKILDPGFVKFNAADAAALQELLQYKQELIDFAEMQKAKSIIIHKWRAAVIAFAAFLIAVGVLWDKGVTIFQGISGGLK